MNLKNKTLALVVASALVMPSALAVEGSDGMHYTSAGEGFYASIRVNFHSGSQDGHNPSISNQGSRLGLQGTSEMSHGLEGFYRYETEFGVDNGQDGIGNTRLGYVGLRGGFGSIRVGSDWSDEYNFVYSATDIANVNSGNFVGVGRASRSIYYNSPDFNGLQVAARFELDGDNEKTNPDDSELDAWALSAKYDFSGFTVGGTYVNTPDFGYNGSDLKDRTSWAIRGSYGQDNWGVSTWYGVRNDKDFGLEEDQTVFSIAGNVDVGPTSVYVVHDTKEEEYSAGNVGDDAYTTFGVTYNFNSQARTWIEYAAQDFDSNPEAEDFVTIGLRHDF